MFDTPEEKAALKAAIDEAVESATTGLAGKNRELLAELKDARKGQAIDPAKVAALEDRIDALTADLATANKAAKDATKAAEVAAKALESESGFSQRLLVDNGLMAALTAHGVSDPYYQKGAAALLRSHVQVVIDGDNRIAKIGDKPLDDAIKEWAGSDEGKRYIMAPGNSGGGAPGGAGGSAGNADLMKLPPVERMSAARAAQNNA